jgi:hypothetical protein
LREASGWFHTPTALVTIKKHLASTGYKKEWASTDSSDAEEDRKVFRFCRQSNLDFSLS